MAFWARARKKQNNNNIMIYGGFFSQFVDRSARARSLFFHMHSEFILSLLLCPLSVCVKRF